MNHLTALLLGFCIDLLLGDPRWLYHPVQAIGALISHLEPPLRRAFPQRLRLAGAVLVIAVVAITGIVTGGLLFLLHRLHPVAGFVGETIVCWLILATKSLRTESMKVVKALENGTLDDGRKAVSMIVGRDTEHLSEEEVLKAAVETVAENASDGILAPLLFAAVLGPVGGMCYKAVNTMDSMVGYKNDRYLDFGRAAAKVDDVLNFLPARISGFLMCLAAYLGFDGKNAFRIFFRDRKNHASPNSAHTEAACAGALGIQLGGTHDYFGKPVVKPTIGDDLRPVRRGDVAAANRLALLTAILALLLFDLLPLLAVWRLFGW